ncbi:MAG: S-methyl-5-thioribose-1-phosphate isomerase [Candidatus Krumholzibacteriales bacterium]
MLIETIDYRQGSVRIIDQTLLPAEFRVLKLETLAQVAEAIKSLRVRGAPALGIAAAYGMLLELDIFLRGGLAGRPRYLFDREDGIADFEISGLRGEEIISTLSNAADLLRKTRPTAVNLFWAADSMMSAVSESGIPPRRMVERAAEKAFEIHQRELACEYSIGEHGSRYIEDGMNILTHCNAGGLATAGYGTALAVIYRAHQDGKSLTVYADETRPLLQGARLTAWELGREGIDVRILCDSAAASLIASSGIDCVIVGADRIAANGDTANKIGTLALAVFCSEFNLPFYVAAPLSTFDPALENGAGIDIEQRAAEEVSHFAGKVVAPEGVKIYNPAFDITPASYITSIITDKGVIERPGSEKIRAFIEDHAE